MWIAADEAYAASSSVLTPWPGKKQTAAKDSFNFWLSSSRIHVEQAFGILVARWGVLWRPLQIDYRKAAGLIMALLKLHNYCLDHNDAAADRHQCDVHLPDTSPLLRASQMPGVADGQGRRRDRENCPFRTEFTNHLRVQGIVRPQY